MRSWLNCVCCGFEIPLNVRALVARMLVVLLGCMVAGQFAFAGSIGGGNWEVVPDGGGFELDCLWYDACGICNGNSAEDCSGNCAEGYEYWVGDGWCDGVEAPYGIDFMCEEWQWDDGDCCEMNTCMGGDNPGVDGPGGDCSYEVYEQICTPSPIPWLADICYSVWNSYNGTIQCDGSCQQACPIECPSSYGNFAGCDGMYNNPACNFDDGNCYVANCDTTSVGNGWCGPDYNIAQCGYDGGDCCESTCEGSACASEHHENCGTECIDPDPAANTDNCWEDCDGDIFTGTYYLDNWLGDGICDNNDSAYYPNFGCNTYDCDGGDCEDCNGTCNGSAYNDGCGDCVEGTTGLYPCAQDCNDTWGGSAYYDMCMECVGGTTGQDPCSLDCMDEWGGSAYLVDVFYDGDGDGMGDLDNWMTVCSGEIPSNYVTNHDDEDDTCQWNTYDCNNNCYFSGWLGDGYCDNGSWSGTVLTCYSNDQGDCVEDQYGSYCAPDEDTNGAYNSGYIDDCDICSNDSDGLFNSHAYNADMDDCGVCFGENEAKDCSGECYGDAYEDNCGVCDANALNDCSLDCLGNWGGSATEDNCGNCDSNPQNDCVQDCNYVWGGTATLDNCGNCDSNEENDCTQDCTNTWGGTAYTDDCEICSGGTSGHIANSDIDCNGVCFGSAIFDNCGDCVNGNTGDIPCLSDCAGVFGGSSQVDMCGICDTDPDNDCIQDCNGDWGGSAYSDDCNMCSGGDSGHAANSNKDCNGDCFGAAFTDSCGVCSGGNSGHGANSDQDCASVCFGTTTIDDCGVCGGDNTVCADACGVLYGDNSTCEDCGGVPNGSNWVSECGCVPQSNSGDDCDDCAGTPNGGALVDMCGTCDVDESNDCIQDCAGEWGGDSELDCIGQCVPADILSGGMSYIGDGWCDNQAYVIMFNGNILAPDLVCAEWDFDGGDCDDDCGIPLGGNNLDTGVGPNLDCMNVCYGSAQLDDCGVCDEDSSNDGPENCDYCDDDINRDEQVSISDAIAWVNCVVLDIGCPHPEDPAGGECNTRDWCDLNADGARNVFDVLKVVEGIFTSLANPDACYTAPSSAYSCSSACFDGIDNDDDGLKDCQDSDCGPLCN